MTRQDTRRPDPARYVESFDAGAIRALEAATAGAPDPWRRCSPSAHAEYARDVGCLIGWDDGNDAMISYVECSGGLSAGRVYHGRPMHGRNPKLRSLGVRPPPAAEGRAQGAEGASEEPPQ
jgi:hypothetical protein